MNPSQFIWAEQLSPQLLKSPWWIGHIPFAYELIGRLRPRSIVELGTYSGSSFAAFCQAAKAIGTSSKCYGIDLWEGDIHMGRFDEELFREISDYLAANYADSATLIRKNFNTAVHDFDDGSIDLLHIDGTHTFEAVSNDFNTWLPKLSDRSVVLFHDINVTVEKAGEAARQFGVRQFFDSVRVNYPHFEFSHCWGLGVLVTGNSVPQPVLELVMLAKDATFISYFEMKGAAVSKQFDDLGVGIQIHPAYETSPETTSMAAIPSSLWQRALHRFSTVLGRSN